MKSQFMFSERKKGKQIKVSGGVSAFNSKLGTLAYGTDTDHWGCRTWILLKVAQVLTPAFSSGWERPPGQHLIHHGMPLLTCALGYLVGLAALLAPLLQHTALFHRMRQKEREQPVRACSVPGLFCTLCPPVSEQCEAQQVVTPGHLTTTAVFWLCHTIQQNVSFFIPSSKFYCVLLIVTNQTCEQG